MVQGTETKQSRTRTTTAKRVQGSESGRRKVREMLTRKEERAQFYTRIPVSLKKFVFAHATKTNQSVSDVISGMIEGLKTKNARKKTRVQRTTSDAGTFQ